MKLHVLCGPIASCKSSYTINAAKDGTLCVNDDTIVSMLHGNDYTLYDPNLKFLYKSIENHIISIAFSMNRSVIIDRGLSCSKKGRLRWIALAKSFDVEIGAIIFKNEGPEIHAKRRSMNDSRGHSYEYWLKVAKLHENQYSIPTLEEGFNTVNHISFEEIQQGKIFL